MMVSRVIWNILLRLFLRKAKEKIFTRVSYYNKGVGNKDFKDKNCQLGKSLSKQISNQNQIGLINSN